MQKAKRFGSPSNSEVRDTPLASETLLPLSARLAFGKPCGFWLVKQLRIVVLAESHKRETKGLKDLWVQIRELGGAYVAMGQSCFLDSILESIMWRCCASLESTTTA